MIPESYLVSAIIATLTALMGVLTWIGKGAITQMSEIQKSVDSLKGDMNTNMKEINTTLTTIERDLRKEIAEIDSRVARIEGMCEKNRVQ